MAGRLGERRQLVAEHPCGVGKHDLLVLDAEPAGVHAGEVEQVGGELRQAVDLLARRREEARPRLLVEVLVGHQLEEAREREERRAKLVRRVRDELLARRVELRELDAHPLERRRELAQLVVAEVDDGLVELALGDPVRGPLEPADPPRVQRRGRAAEDRRDRERDPRRVQQPPLDDPHRGELVLDRRREQEDVAVEQRNGATSPNGRPPSLDAPARDRRLGGGLERDGVVATGPARAARIGERRQRERRPGRTPGRRRHGAR